MDPAGEPSDCMVQSTYPFIDIAVLDAVRGPLLAGDAIVVLDASLEEIVWANGPGAVLFGHEDVESARGAQANLGMAARRQIASTPGFPRIGPGRSLLVRLPQGLSSQAIGFVASQVRLPDGTAAIMLAAPDAKAKSRSAEESGARAIYGIAQDGQHAALVGPKGAIIAQSKDFSKIGIGGETLARLAEDVANEADRLAKRLVRAKGRSLPAGVALLAENPLRALVIVVEDTQSEEPAPAFGALPNNPNARPDHVARSAPAEDNWHFVDRRKPVRQAEDIAVETRQDTVIPPAYEPAYESDMPAIVDNADEWQAADAVDWDGDATDEIESLPDHHPANVPDQLVLIAADAEDDWREPEDESHEFDGAVDDDDTPGETTMPSEMESQTPDDSHSASTPPEDEPAGFAADPNASPVRFVWKTDADGQFSSLSPEFASTVGHAAADVIGQKFRDVAQRFAMDPDGEIAGLLERRDTWSGRSVMWPISGTDLKAPVDLAALPVYGRDRNFEGFRGFGVVRASDAVIDEDAIGLVLAGRADQTVRSQDKPEPTTASATSDGPFGEEVPVLDVEATPGRRSSDKVIHLAEHRQTPAERSLSSTESNAFREIAARLREAEKQPATPANGNSEAPAAGPAAHTGENTVLPDEPVAAEPDDADEPAHSNAVAEHVSAPWDDENDQFADDGEIETGRSDDLFETDTDFASAETDAVPADVSPDTDDDFEDAAVDDTHDSVSLLEKLPVAVIVHAGDTLHYANDEFFRLTGYASLADFDDAGGLEALFVEGDETAFPDDHRRRLRTKDGREFPVEAQLQSVPWAGGKSLLLALKAEPETTPASAGAPADTDDLDLRLTEMRAILDTATDGIIIITNEGAIRSVSRPAEALFGFDSFELVGKPFVSLFAVESQRAARDYLGGLSDNGVASVLNDGREVIGREAQGRFIPLFMTIGRLPGGNGYCAVLRDITQWKRAEEELTQARAEAERSSGQKTEFLARISHEIRTPLNAIIGFSELMIDEKFGPIVNDRYKDYLRDINRSGNHVLDLVNDLLDISKIEAGEQEMAHEAVSLNESLAEAVAMMQPQANRERVIIRSSFASRLPEVVADQRSIRQIALNLLSNAVRYTQAGGQVIVSTAYENTGDVVMRVRDTGIGMSQSEIEQALKPFKQINALKRPRGDGTGLGLPLTKAMVEANRARFSIHSTPGEGTMVEIIFPSTRVLAG
jgi:PAS domain S-box-containing protein